MNKIKLLALIGLALVFTACSVIGGSEGNPLPTPKPEEDVGEEAKSAAEDTPEGTWENYLRDIIAEQVADRTSKIELIQRYENPDITEQNLGGLLTNIGLVEDRTEFSTSGGLATAHAEFDIRLTFGNGDTDTRTCTFNVSLEFHEEDGVWYVINPAALAVFTQCG